MFRLLLLGALAVAGFSVYIWLSAPLLPRTQPEAAPVVVKTERAVRRNVPIILSGIGTAQAVLTAQIKSRVDGALETTNFKEGQRVRKGDVLARIDPRLYQAALDQAKAKLAQDQAQLASDEKDLDRAKQLVERKFTSQQSVDQLTAKVGVDQALLGADKALIEGAQTNLDYTTITAPFDGIMSIRAIDPGNIVHAADNTPIATLTEDRPITVLFTLPEAQLAEVRDALRQGDVPVTALDETGKKPVASGSLRVVDNQIDQASGTIRLKAEFPNKDGALWPGQFTPVRVQVGVSKNAVVVPTASLQRGPEGIFVWVATPDGHAAMRPVETAQAFEDVTVAVKGVAPGDLIVTSNQYRLQPDARVEVESEANAARLDAGQPRS